MNIKNSVPSSLGERIRREISAHRRKNYWITIAILSGVAGIIALFFGWRREPTAPVQVIRMSGVKPDFKILSIEEMPVRNQERLTVKTLVSSTADEESLRLVIDWVLYQVLNEYNRTKRRNVQIVWIYAYDQKEARSYEWRAMAVYVDPRLPQKNVPDAARIGGDAIRDGAVEYDFTNPVLNLETTKRGGI